MGKDNANSTFDFDNDSEFSDNFYKNIEKALGDNSAASEESEKDLTTVAEEKSEPTDEVQMSEEKEKEPVENITAAALPFAKEEDEEEIDDELININSSLAKQISSEMEKIETDEKQQKKRRFLKIQSGIVLALLLVVGFGFFLGFTKPGNMILMKMGINLGGKLWSAYTNDFDDSTDTLADVDYLDEEDLASNAEEIDPSTIVWPAHPGEGRQEEGVYNILLLGEEAIGSGDGRGRTDVMVVATMNTNTKKLRLTSLMRDMYVQIPGYNGNKLNSAYEKGGLDLLYETIALNFDLHLDGCVKVNFSKFEKIIDELGGLDIELTQGEADYLNSTNYISNPAYRDVVAGMQHLNGNQVLGYSRVRKRSTITGNNNDYGRTDRHRIVLNAIFEKYKSKSKAELASLMFKFLPMITTDIDSKNFEMLLNAYFDMGTTEIQQLRIPADGTFSDDVKIRGMDVLIPNFDENIDILHQFVFDDTTAQSTVTADAGSNGTD
jgi:LCP family protein required for cell wall assembly